MRLAAFMLSLKLVRRQDGWSRSRLFLTTAFAYMYVPSPEQNIHMYVQTRGEKTRANMIAKAVNSDLTLLRMYNSDWWLRDTRVTGTYARLDKGQPATVCAGSGGTDCIDRFQVFVSQGKDSSGTIHTKHRCAGCVGGCVNRAPLGRIMYRYLFL